MADDTTRARVDMRIRFEEGQRLARFFSKTFGEALHLGADAICVIRQKDELRVQLLRLGSELKSLQLSLSWFDPLYTWLAQRAAPAFAELLALPEGRGLPGAAADGDQLFVYRLGKLERSSSEQRFRVTGLAVRRRAELIAAIDPAECCRMALTRSCDPAPGLLIIGAPQLEQLGAAKAAALVLTGALYAGDLRDEEVRRALPAMSAEFAVAVGVEAPDALSALLGLREQGCELNELRLRGVLCLAFIKRICPACAREAVLDPQRVEFLPGVLQPGRALKGYRVGRGCDECGHRGYKGLVCLQSVLAESGGEVSALLRAGAPDSAFIQQLWPQGLRALLQDGVQKVLRGQSTFEALAESVRAMPEGYVKHLQQEQAAGASSSEQQLPAAQSAKPDRSPQSAEDGASAAPSAPRVRQKPLVLVVEDDKDQRSILEMIFKAAGYDVQLACDGQQALDAVQRDTPDVVVTDLMMPRIDGAELVTKLRADPLHRRLPILVLTVVSEDEREYTLLDLGADDYCDKTVQRKILLKRVENLLRRREQG